MTTLFCNGKVWQWPEHVSAIGTSEHEKQDQYQPFANWFVVNQTTGKIDQVGFGDQIPPEIEAKATNTIDLNHALVLPGLQDAHLHTLGTGKMAQYVDLAGTNSVAELQRRIRGYADTHPDKKWIIGFGWEQDKLDAEGRYPSRHDLDAAVSDRPVLLHRACWHIAVVNTKALELAHMDVSQNHWNVESGQVDVDGNGVTGVLREHAVGMVAKHSVDSSRESLLSCLRTAVNKCVSYGLTGLQTNDRHDPWPLYQQLQKQGELPLRIFWTPIFTALDTSEVVPPNTHDGLLSCDRVKLFSDGSLGAETAAVREPYRGSNNRGILMETDEKLLSIVTKIHEQGYRHEIHAIGDRAAEQVLRVLKQAGIPPERRPILTHCQILGPDLLDQMRDQGAIGNIQPSFTITDSSYVAKRLEPHVIPYSYAWKTMMQHGIVCAGGSDAPIESVNPFQGMFDAMFRRKPGDSEDQTFLAHERMSFSQALRLYTINAAYAAVQEQRLGQIRRGFEADFVVLRYDVTQDFTKLVLPDLVRSVYVAGNKTFERN